MHPYIFAGHIEALTGRPVGNLTPSEEDFLTEALRDDQRVIDYSQFNELLLIVNKDRVTELFFDQFFRSACAIGSIPERIDEFRKIAMLCFGNFIYAYRMLSKAQTEEELEEHLGDYFNSPSDLLDQLMKRSATLLETKTILREHTYLVGYLSAGEIRQEYKIVNDLFAIFENAETWEEVEYALNAIKEEVDSKNQDSAVINRTIALVAKYRRNTAGDDSIEGFRRQLAEDVPRLRQRHQLLEATLDKGARNTDIYLSWDHMDVYFATSMRKRWEYEDLHDFVNKLMREPIKEVPDQVSTALGKTLTDLKVRYFDPTQSYDKNRINKGLVEALMLKRAACTVYSVQDTDTLGKDSELAATLAQGKPVIAFAPQVDVTKKVEVLKKLRPADLKSRLQFVLHADESGFQSGEASSLLQFVPTLESFEAQMLWKSIIDEDAHRRFQEEHQNQLDEFCRIIAMSEERIYNKRERTLRKDHPLALQVNLTKGVANGVLVVRDEQKCAQLLLRILTNTMEFTIEYDRDTDCWLLVEKISRSVFRVVTGNRKLTNCFWNFYLPRSRGRKRQQ